jgi:DNA-directed RNA polymerase specialized sigma24 family protein
MKRKRPKSILRPLLKIPGILDDFTNKYEVRYSSRSFARLVEAKSVGNFQEMSEGDTQTIHSLEDDLDASKVELVKCIMAVAKKSMNGVQLQAFMMSFKLGVSKCELGRIFGVSRQSIQIRNRRALRRLKQAVYKDQKCRKCLADMQEIRRKILEFERDH